MKKFLDHLDNSLLVINAEGVIKFMNQSSLNLFNCTAIQVEGLHLDELLEVDCPSLLSYVGNSIINQTPLQLKSKKGIFYSLDATKQSWNNEDCFFIILRTTLKDVNLSLVSTLLDRLPFSIGIQNEKDEHVYMNETFIRKHTEYLPTNFTGELLDYINDKHWKEQVWGKDQIGLSKHYNAKARTLNETQITQYSIYKNGEKYTTESFIIPLKNETTQTTYIATVSKDITFTNKLEQMLKNNKRLSELTTFPLSTYSNTYQLTLLKNLGNIMIHEFNADQISLWIYKKEENLLQSVFNYKNEDYLNPLPTSIKLTDKQVASIASFPYINQISPIKDRYDLKPYDLKFKKEVGFIGTYEIKSEQDNQLLGLLNVIYKKGKKASPQEDYIIKSTCKQIALLIENDYLVHRIYEELIRRQETEQELEAFLSTAVDLMAIIDRSTGHFIKVSDGWQKTLGWSKSELLSHMRWQDLEHTENQVYHANHPLNESSIIRGYITKCRCKNGQYKYLEWNYIQMKDRNMFVCTARDLTAENQLKAQKKALEEAIQLESFKNEFFANISHELRTPLNIILSSLQLLNNVVQSGTIIDDEQFTLTTYMESMKKNVYQLLKLINNMIDLTRINAGYYPIKLENYNIVSLVESITDSIIQYIEANEMHLIFDTEIEEEYIAYDPDLIERIMLNLLSNSIKYNRDKGNVWVYIALTEDYVSISVKDDGIGIPEEHLGSIFNRFVRVDHTMSTKREGSGIGLSLVKSLVEMHDGHILVESQINEGSTFTINLPRKTLPDQDYKDWLENHACINLEKHIVEFSDIYN
ncbi:MAG: PAS domain-containing sensor histidine kinase [Candidatus Niameybacter stercoravium]|nr:PAS domain-containing sensor histidine kinase [Candidatus Niameybacter stercoravium]